MRKYFLLIFLLTVSFFSARAQTVYKTPYGSKYHTASCHTVKNVSEKLSVQEAAAAGLTPCKICKPAVATTLPYESKKPAGEAQTVQCKGITRAGNRCKHMTSIGNGYCFQHQPE